MIDSKDWLQSELLRIEAWEKDQGDLWFWEKIGRLPFKIMDKWTPKFIQTKMGTLLDELGQYIQTGGSYLSSTSKIKSYYPNMGIDSVEDVNRLPVSTMDKAVKGITKKQKKYCYHSRCWNRYWRYFYIVT